MSLAGRMRALLAGAAILMPVAASAQGWNLDLGAGSTSHGSVPGGAEALGATFGIRYEGARWLALSGSVPFDPAGLPWGVAGAGARMATRGRLAVGIDVAANGFAYRDPASGETGGGATGTALPLVSLDLNPARLELRSGVVQYSSTFAGQSSSRTLHQSDARVSVGAAGLRIAAEGRYLRAAEGDYPYAGADAELSAGAAALFAYAGQWLSDSIPTASWGAGVRLQVRPSTQVFAALQQESREPIYWNAPRTGWSVGLTQRLGGRRAARPTLAPEVGRAGTTFRLPLSAAPQAPAVAGDFTGWTPVAMRREGAFWSVTLPVPAGVHRYAFRRADGAWFVPETLPGRTDDGFGGLSAVLVVPHGGP
ncbi:MAG: glycogen-binding domain-containing protein [Gemmatimonadetes bacterium]|nr:glycogen-binding domain-containing protein [Gemmatimonadota bacterium]